uniref:Uncharacterized protein n=1 Tax=Meloidogyne enterolobii TaxID=390850 RepID=A0A6V7YAI1_MELEN|nr:unnamed protein product [Meloidogyne enterolobii]
MIITLTIRSAIILNMPFLKKNIKDNWNKQCLSPLKIFNLIFNIKAQ